MTIFTKLILAGIFIAVAAADSRSAGAESMQIKVERATPDPVYAGQRIAINVKLMTPTMFASDPIFEFPNVRGVLLMHVDERPVLGTEQVGDDSFVTQLHQLVLFCMTPGKHEIPAFAVRVESPPKFGAPPEEHRLMTSPISIETPMPPGAENLRGIICSQKFTVQQKWSPEPGETATVGDSFTRQVTLSTPDVAGMAMPPLPLAKVDGLTAYPKPPTVQDRIERGTFTGERTDTVVYIVDRPGRVEFPAIEIPWWNLDNNSLAHETLPGLSIEVKPRETHGTAVTEPKTGKAQRRTSSESARYALLTSLACVSVLAFILWRRRGELSALLTRWHDSQAASEIAKFNVLKMACHNNNATATYNALLDWMECFHSGEGAVTFEADLPGYTSRPELRHEVDALQEAVIDSRNAWNSTNLWRELCQVRQSYVEQTSKRLSNPLPPLNPMGQAAARLSSPKSSLPPNA